MKRPIWSAVLITVLLLALAKQTSVWIVARSSVLAGHLKGVFAHLDGSCLAVPKHALAAGGVALIGILAALLTKHRAGRFSAGRLLACRGLPAARIARRTRMAQDAVRMLKPDCHALPRRRALGNSFRPAQLTARRRRCVDVVSD